MMTLETQAELPKTAAAVRNMAADTTELGEGHVPLVLDAIELGGKAWAAISEETVARCWLKADILPLTMQAEPAVKHGKPARTPAADPTFQKRHGLLDRLYLDGRALAERQGAGQLEADQADMVEAMLALGSGAVE
ncbi:unnamed protein product [Phaeothamnion confervicola]